MVLLQAVGRIQCAGARVRACMCMCVPCVRARVHACVLQDQVETMFTGVCRNPFIESIHTAVPIVCFRGSVESCVAGFHGQPESRSEQQSDGGCDCSEHWIISTLHGALERKEVPPGDQ